MNSAWSRFLGAIVAGVIALALGAGAARAEDAPAVTGVRGDILKSINDARSELLELAEAMPADKYAWRPGKGVRSVGEVYMHVAQANFLIPSLMGVAVPTGVDAMALDKLAGDKAKVIAMLKDSFDHATSAVRTTPEANLEKTVKIFDHDGTVRELELILVSHAHEHLGQSIAYARMNNVTPPWTARQEAAQAKAAAEKGK